MVKYKRGDVVKVWSLQSSDDGFINGKPAIVGFDQSCDVVSLIVTTKPNADKIDPYYVGMDILDTRYEVYQQQTKLIKVANGDDRVDVTFFLSVLKIIRMYESKFFNSGGNNIKYQFISYDYAPEFYIDNNFKIKLNYKKFKYPELIIKHPELFENF